MPNGTAPQARSASSLEMAEQGLRRTNLYHSARGTVVMLVLLSMTASGTLAAALSKMRPGDLSHDAVVALAVILAVSQNVTLLVFVRHRCINPPPAHVGRTVLFYYLMWIVMQAVGFVCVDHMWLSSWPEAIKNLCSMWMLLSILTMGLWTIAIVSAASRRLGHQYPEFRAAPRRAPMERVETRRTAPAVVRGAIGEEAASFIQPPPYAAVRDTKKGLA
ncbi:hypothetical protein CDEST_01462 [Colletotrichum destructivum]|uniref:Uncharacterized protein n=1 Tax=Colletotrichum destructivum TaxID=34406 RepID=A0AAX4I0B3_9PEZI|nr:hypothetical protein CDEST_01462 [Colletotrichum destructivum]